MIGLTVEHTDADETMQLDDSSCYGFKLQRLNKPVRVPRL